MTFQELVFQLKVKYKIYGPVNSLRFFCQRLFRLVYYQLLLHSYSQFGEDLIIARLLPGKKIFYVDVGANHPQKFNNTYHFYRRGSRGITVDPHPSLKPLFSRFRPRDHHLSLGLSRTPGFLTFYQFFPDVNSTFSSTAARHYLSEHSQLISQKRVEVTTLATILDQHLPPHQPVDLLSIDTEGFDYQVLQGNNWQKYRPQIVCLECQPRSKANDYLLKLGYKLVARTPLNSIYQLHP